MPPEEMRKPGLAGCRYCGHIESIEVSPEAGEVVGTCPRCSHPLRSLGLLGATLLSEQVRRDQEMRRRFRDSR